MKNKYNIRVEEERNMPLTTKRRITGFGNILHKNCLLKHVIERKSKRIRRRVRRCKQLLITLRKKKDTGN
jgi:hypothetical protein